MKLRFLPKIILFFVICVIVVLIFIVQIWNSQGLDWKGGAHSIAWLSPESEVVTDMHGIPTIKGSSWQHLIKSQGYVQASQRLWQMDLLRRAATGRLAEWFGEKAEAHDAKKAALGWDKLAQLNFDALPDDEKAPLIWYAEGVNKFIAGHLWKWGNEYLILRKKPQEWKPWDGLSILMQMSDDLTQSHVREFWQFKWKQKLPPSWYSYLFPAIHPKASPYVGKVSPNFSLPPSEFALNQSPIGETELKRFGKGRRSDLSILGSNAWAYLGEKGRYLANDPHLYRRSPSIWQGMRLYINPKEWVAGVSLPGVPGVIIGMNRYLAWAMTNSYDDVDDLVYAEGEQENKNIEMRTGKNNIVHLTPVSLQGMDEKRSFYRKWLGQTEGLLSFPVLKMNQSTDWSSFNRAIDRFQLPSQNLLVMETDKPSMGYRLTGSRIKRSYSGTDVMPLEAGKWLEVEAPHVRPRLYYDKGSSSERRFLINANNRIWHDSYDYAPAGEERAIEINDRLSRSNALTREDMKKIQLDTSSAYYKKLSIWVSDIPVEGLPSDHVELLNMLRSWDGAIESNPKAFGALLEIEAFIFQILINRLKDTYFSEMPESDKDAIPYWNFQKRGIISESLDNPRFPGIFGTTKQDLVRGALAVVSQRMETDKIADYPYYNRWKSQHPFASNVPLIGKLFSLDEIDQIGYAQVIRVEGNYHGASMRMIWDLSDPMESEWSLPIGQSGHPNSTYYDNFHASFVTGKYWKVFDKSIDWGF